MINHLKLWLHDNLGRQEASSTYLHRIVGLLPLIIFILVIYPIAVSKVIAMDTFVIGDIYLWESAETRAKSFFESYDSIDGGSRIPLLSAFIDSLLVAAFGQLAAGKVFLLLLIPSAMLSMFYASKILLSSLTGRYLAAFVYAINPITIGEFISASVLLAFYAILPLVLFTFVRLLEATTSYWKYILKFSLITSLAIILLIDSIILLPFFLLTIALLYLLTHRERLFHIVRNIFSATGVIFLLLLPIIIGYYETANSIGEDISTRGLSRPFGDIIYTYGKAYLFNLVRLAGNDGTGMAGLGYNEPDFSWSIVGLVIPITAFSFLAFAKAVPKSYLLISLLVVAISVILFIWATSEKFTFPLFESFPLLFILRNPRKIMFILSISMSLLFAFGATQLISKIAVISRRRYASVLLVSTIMALLLAYNWPLFTGDLGMSKSYGSNNFPDLFLIPERYFIIAEDLRSLPYEDHRTIWLPMDKTTQYTITGLELNSFFLPAGSGLGLRGSSPEYYTTLFDVLIKQETFEWGKWLSTVNVKYIVVDKSVNQQGEPNLVAMLDTLYPMGDPLKYYDLLRGQTDLRLVTDNREYAIFENLEYSSVMTLYDMSALPYLKSGNADMASDYLVSGSALKLEKLSESHYRIQGTITKDLIVVISTNYDPTWKPSNNQITEHFKAFNWANGFIIKSGNVDSSIQYTFQQVYVITATVAYSAWVIAFVALFRPWVYAMRFSRRQSR